MTGLVDLARTALLHDYSQRMAGATQPTIGEAVMKLMLEALDGGALDEGRRR